MTVRSCPVCRAERLAPGRTVGPNCVQQLRERTLPGLPDLMDALTQAVGNLLHRGQRVGGKSAETPVPVNLAASDAAYAARTTLLLWVDHIATARTEPTPDTWHDIQRFLDVRAVWLAGQDAGPDAYRAITDALAAALRAVDRPADRHYAGPCTGTVLDHDGYAADCDGELYAATGRPEVQCPRCGAGYDVTDRREWLLAQAWDTIAPGPDIARALAGAAFGGIGVNLSTLRRWASEGRLTKVDTRGGRPLYRLGDVVDLATGGTARVAPVPERMTS